MLWNRPALIQIRTLARISGTFFPAVGNASRTLLLYPHGREDEGKTNADLDVLGRPDFVTRNQDLHAELAAFEGALDDCDWYRIQLAFLRDHRYWTASARRLREEQKQRNIAALADLLETCQRS